jgi:glycosyltransferase involved in cell wall biosynthesis
MPSQVRFEPGMIDLNYTMFEATRIPFDWVGTSERCHFTILPTESSRLAWAESGAPVDRLRISPLGLRSEIFAKQHEPLPLLTTADRPISRYRHRFLNISAMDSRKNLEGLLKVWLRATNRNDDAVLVLKIGCYEPGRRQLAERVVRGVQKGMGKQLSAAAPLILIFDILPDGDMPRLYASATHYLSLSHGEGWDLPMMEAVGSGLVPIAPDHSAYQSYLDASVAHLLPSTEISPMKWIGADPASLFAGATFWQPDEDVAVDVLRSIIHRGVRPKSSARERILTEYSWERSTHKLIAILNEADSMGFSPAL